MVWSVITERLEIDTRGDGDVIDLTDRIATRVAEHRLREGQVLLFVGGSTGALTTIEYEPGAVRDLKELFERIAPVAHRYHHEEAWHDGNGHSHVRASLLGPSLTLPVSNGELLCGSWQQVVFVDFDNRPRRRRVVIQLVGEIRTPG